MSNIQRYLAAAVQDDLQRKMVLVVGPRQVGKTTFARSLLPEHKRSSAYLNWDDVRVRPRLLRGELPDEPLIVLDEIHKYLRWRNLLKGMYDTRGERTAFLVTGSARLDHYRRGGDSLMGRYHLYRMGPLTVSELGEGAGPAAVEQLMRFGGFPEPFFAASDRTLRRWHLSRFDQVLREDLRDLERVREVELLVRLAELLPARVGSPLSLNNLRQDLEVDHKTVEHWMQILENLYYGFRIAPFGVPRIRAVKKEQKFYLWDWSQVEDEAARFENMTAVHLLKHCHFRQDREGVRMELRYLRDTDRREVDFIVLESGKPSFAVECKLRDTSLAPPLTYFSARLPRLRWFQVHLAESAVDRNGPGIRILPFLTLCRELGL